MKPVISVETMRLSDAHTIKTKISSKELMYKAGQRVFEMCSPSKNTAIVCGCGNNAGDGYVIALEMAKRQMSPTIILVENKFSADGLYYFDKCKDANIPYIFADETTSFEQYDEIIDCIFGTGFRGEPHGIAGSIIDKINASQKRVISVDINSGLNGDNGLYIKCVKSNLTVSVGYFKTGFFLGEAHKVIGKLINADIGIELVNKGYFLAESEYELPKNYTTVEITDYMNPIQSLIECANGNFVRYRNIVTNGEETYILAGDIPYEY